MPYESAAQRRFFHTPTARKHGITAAMVKEWDNASRGQKVPEHKSKHAAAAAAIKRMGRTPPSPLPVQPPPPEDAFKELSRSQAASATQDSFQDSSALTMPVVQ